MTARAPAIGLLAALAAGCGGALGTPPCEDGGCGTQVSTKGRFQFNINRNVDLLFVVDDTPAIAPYADRLAAGFAEMARELPIGPLPPSLHVAFVRAGTCDASTRSAACGVAAPEQFLRSEWCNTVANFNYAGGFADAFPCLADLGASDCGPAQPLAAAVQALTGAPRAGWEGFLRPNAYLMIVVVAAGDDASGPPGSPTAVSDVVARLRALKADTDAIAVSVIGPGDCGAGDVTAARLLELVDAFGANGLYLGLCGGQFGAALTPVTDYGSIDLVPPCISNLRDTDAVTPGMQADCSVVRNSFGPDGSILMSPVASCDTSPPPCWRLTPATCGNGRAGWSINVDEAPDWCFEAGENFSVECLGCADPNDPACRPAQAR